MSENPQYFKPWPRWEVASDRFIFQYWLHAKRPSKRIMWALHDYEQYLMIQFSAKRYRSGKALCVHELYTDVRGWRYVVADTIRQMRREVKAKCG